MLSAASTSSGVMDLDEARASPGTAVLGPQVKETMRTPAS